MKKEEIIKIIEDTYKRLIDINTTACAMEKESEAKLSLINGVTTVYKHLLIKRFEKHED